MSWRVVKLGGLIEIFSIKAKDFEVDVSKLDFLGVSNTEGITKSKYAAEEKADDYKIMEKGCFAYNPYRINVGSIAMLEDDVVGLISPAYVVFKVKEKSIIPELLLKFLKSSEGLRQIKLHARGTVRQALRFSDLCKIEISLPNYYEQQEFYKTISNTEIESSKLSIELTHQLDLVKQLRQAFLREAMQGELTKEWRANHPELIEGDSSATALLKKIKAEKEKLIKEKKIKKQKPLPPITEEEIPFEIPENWDWCRMGDLALYSEAGKSFKCDEVQVSGNEWGVIKVSAVSWNEFRENENKLYLNNTPDNLQAKIKKGDFIISRANTSELVGKSVVVKKINKNLLLSDKTIRFTFSSQVSTEFINKYNNSEYARMYYAYNGTGSSPSMKNITRVHMNELLIPLPAFPEQQQIVAKLDELMAYCDGLEESIKTSQAQNEMLLGQVLREALEPKIKK